MKKFHTCFQVPSFLTAFGSGLSAQSIQGSFESEFKRDTEKGQFSATRILFGRLIGLKGARLYSQLLVLSSTNRANLTHDVNGLTKSSSTARTKIWVDRNQNQIFGPHRIISMLVTASSLVNATYFDVPVAVQRCAHGQYGMRI